MDDLAKLTTFLKLNTEIKEILMNEAPLAYLDYDMENKIKAMDKIIKATNVLESKFEAIESIIPLSDYIRVFFQNLKRKIENFSYKNDNLQEFYFKNFADISENIINETNQTCFGYNMFAQYFSILKKCQTINELLHVIHARVLNNELIYENIKTLKQKINPNNSQVYLKGVDSVLAQTIFDNLRTDLKSDFMFILAPSEKQVLIMARDLGHALMIDITLEKQQIYVKYFLPKIWNLEMVKQLKGIEHIKPLDENYEMGWATGSFHTSIEDFMPVFNQFIDMVPTDRDIIQSKHFR